MTERFYVSDPPTEPELAQARAWVQHEFKAFFEHAKNEGIAIDDRIVAVAGTATSVVSMDKKMEVYDSALVDGVTVQVKPLNGLYRQLSSMPMADRKQVVGLQPERASVLLLAWAFYLKCLRHQIANPSQLVNRTSFKGLILDAYEQGK